MNLYESNAALRDLFAQIVSQEGEVTPEQEVEMNRLAQTRVSKINGCAAYIRNRDVDARMLEAAIQVAEGEIQRMRDRQKKIEADKARLMAYVEKCVPRTDELWNDPVLGKFEWKRSLKVDTTGVKDVRKLPERFIRHHESYEPDKIELRKAITKEGIVIEGVTLKEQWALKLQE